MNLFTKQKYTPGHRKQTYGYQRRCEGKINQEFEINIYTERLYIKQINNKNLFYSIGNATQYFIMTYIGKESNKQWIYVYA